MLSPGCGSRFEHVLYVVFAMAVDVSHVGAFGNGGCHLGGCVAAVSQDRQSGFKGSADSGVRPLAL